MSKKAMGRGLGALLKCVEADHKKKQEEIKTDPNAQKKRDIIIYKNVFERAWADRGVTRDELSMLEALRETLELKEAEWQRIEQWVKDRAAEVDKAKAEIAEPKPEPEPKLERKSVYDDID